MSSRDPLLLDGAVDLLVGLAGVIAEPLLEEHVLLLLVEVVPGPVAYGGRGN